MRDVLKVIAPLPILSVLEPLPIIYLRHVDMVRLIHPHIGNILLINFLLSLPLAVIAILLNPLRHLGVDVEVIYILEVLRRLPGVQPLSP